MAANRSALRPLTTSVVGSYPVPEWLEQAKTGIYTGRVSRSHLDDMHDVAIKAAIKDQELAGVDVISDGELRRDNDVDYLLARIPGVRIPQPVKSFYFDYLDVLVERRLPQDVEAPLGLAADLAFTRAHTSRPVRFSLTGAFSLSRRVHNSAYPSDAALVRALAGVLHTEALSLAAAGADVLQLDEPFLAGYPEHVELAVEAVNIVTTGVPVTWALHVCYGNRYARPLWEGHYDFLFPAVLQAGVDQLLLEFARKGDRDLELLSQWDRAVGVGVLDVKSESIEPVEVVAERIRRALAVVPVDRLTLNPDCGLRHLPAPVARGKLRAMVEAAADARGATSPAAVTLGGS